MDILFDSAFFNKKDSIKGISEKIITGQRINLGTGSFDVLFNKDNITSNKQKKPENRYFF